MANSLWCKTVQIAVALIKGQFAAATRRLAPFCYRNGASSDTTKFSLLYLKGKKENYDSLPGEHNHMKVHNWGQIIKKAGNVQLVLIFSIKQSLQHIILNAFFLWISRRLLAFSLSLLRATWDVYSRDILEYSLRCVFLNLRAKEFDIALFYRSNGPQ